MGFRPNCFTCITHSYLYYTLLVPHTYASYIRHWCIFFYWEIQYNLPVFLTWYQSHCFDFFLAVLSSLVLLHSQHHFRHHNRRCSLSSLNLRRLPTLPLGSGPAAAIVEESNTAQITAHVIPPWLLLRSNLWWYHWDRLETIYSSVKALPSSELPRALTRCLNFLRQRITRCHAPHTPSRVQADVTYDVICSTSALAASTSIICWRQHHVILVTSSADRWPLTLTVDFLPELTFAV